MKKTILLVLLATITVGAFATTRRIVKLIKNDAVIQQYLIDDVDYLEVEDVIDPPTSVTAVVVDGCKAKVCWSVVDEAESYTVYRSAEETAGYVAVAENVTDTYWVDKDPIIGINYYKVIAVAEGFTSLMDTKCAVAYISPAPTASKTYTVNGVSFNMVLVERGIFNMGATSEQSNDGFTPTENEYPVHSVTLSDFYLGETEVTQELWQAVMGTSHSSSNSWDSSFGLGDKYPAYNISYTECQEFITKLNELTGETFRIPTEAEWEYAARGGNKSNDYIFSGSNTLENVGWNLDSSGSHTHEVGTKMANELGLYDMSGNVWEWCADWYDSYSDASQIDPVGPDSGTKRVVRGGSWSTMQTMCRVAYRYSTKPDSRGNGLGLRLAF